MAAAEGTVLVTGATGTVGRHVVELLGHHDVPVRRAVRSLHAVRGMTAGDDLTVPFDFADPGTWAAALDGVDRVFLMRPPAISDIKGVISPFVTELARRHLRQTVVLSVMGVNPTVPHYRLERAVREAGVPATMLRPAFFMQNLETAYRDDLVTHDRIRLPAGSSRTSFIDTRDVAEVAVACFLDPAAHTGEDYTLTGGAALGWGEVATLLSAELGRPIRYEPVSLLTARRELRASGLPSGYVTVQLLIHVVARLGLADTLTHEVEDLLGRPPGTLAAYLHDNRGAWLPPD